MPEQLIRQCLPDENMSFGTLHSLPDGHDPCFEPLPMKVAACRSCIHPTVEDDDEGGRSCQDGPLLLNSSPSQAAVQLSTDTTHILILSTLPSVPGHLSESPATITTVFVDHNVVELHHQNSDLGPTDRVKSHSCVKKKRTKGKKRVRDASGTEEDNGARQTKRKKGKGSKSGVLPPIQSGHVIDKASWGSGGTRNLERRVLEDITNRVLHAVT
ncbi:hypothetical protein ARMGADRAFT_1061522 [Armillaria gallica]|uniref:Uncharacterized protein n=1 Tax=Armillaria gallica TaxID=47427 RepID=A0A2H3E6X8_ARMGA|nr:hypothetical protein ARMGADRAFT_1061522 [Armillaria gallica]